MPHPLRLPLLAVLALFPVDLRLRGAPALRRPRSPADLAARYQSWLEEVAAADQPA